MTDVINPDREHHESKVRDVLAVYDRVAVLEDDNARLRHTLDLARQKLTMAYEDLATSNAQRDYYLGQVAAFREKFEHVKNTSIMTAKMVTEMIDESISAPSNRNRQVQAPREVDNTDR